MIRSSALYKVASTWKFILRECEVLCRRRLIFLQADSMESEVKFYSLDDVSKNDGKNGNRTWILIRNNIYDVTDYLDSHPGGGELITEWAGKECTKAFDDAGHSSDANKDLKPYKIGELRKEERTSAKKKETSNSNPKEIRRSFCSYLTCGICG